MIYLSGVAYDRIEPALLAAGIGLMVQPGNNLHKRVLRYQAWAADNACYSDKFDEKKWINWLSELPSQGCLFAVAPDVYPDSRASLERGLPFCSIIRELGMPAAIVAQGSEPIEYPWDEFDCLFIGGARNKENPEAEWKTSQEAADLVNEARKRGKWTHMGRVNSWKRIERAYRMGILSVDGTFLKYRKRHKAGEGEEERHLRGEGELSQWSRSVNAQSLLWRHETPSHPNHRAIG